MPSRVKITPEREEALRRVLAALSDAGVPKATVALALRLHPRTVQQLRVMFGISASTPAPVTWTPEEDAVIQTAMGIGEAMKGLPHRTRAGITERKACLGVRWPRAQGKRRTNIQKARNRPDREVAITLPGEVWKDVPAYGVRVSTLARAASLHTGLLLKSNDRAQIGCRTPDGRRSYATLRKLLPMAFGDSAPEVPKSPAGRFYSKAENDIIRTSKTYGEAHAKLTGRSRAAVIAHAHALGVRLERTPADRSQVIRMPFLPTRDALWAAANTAVPRGIPHHIREDLISDMVLMSLEGFAGTMEAAFKEARRAYNRMTGAFVERSIFDTVRGTEGLRLIDTFQDGVSL